MKIVGPITTLMCTLYIWAWHEKDYDDEFSGKSSKDNVNDDDDDDGPNGKHVANQQIFTTGLFFLVNY